MDETFSKLYDEFMVFVEKNDEEGARSFLVDNLQKFPEEVQNKLIITFFGEAITKEAKGLDGVNKMQKQGLDAMNQIEKLEKVLEDKKKIEDLRSNLTK